MTDPEVDSIIIGAAIPIGAGFGGTLAIIFGGDLISGAIAGVAGGVLIAALTASAIRVGAYRGEQQLDFIAIGAIVGVIVSTVIALVFIGEVPETTALLLVGPIAGAVFGGFLGLVAAKYNRGESDGQDTRPNS